MHALAHRRLIALTVVVVVAVATAITLQARADAPAPNIIIIMADDMGYSDIGCYGGEIRTPNLDRLAAGGLRFTQFYNTARCCPTRASLLTGLYPHQAGVGHMMSDRGSPGYRGDLNDRCVTIAEALRTNGYRNYMAGKWHVTKQTGAWTGNANRMSKHNWPLQRGFDRYWGTIHGAGSYFNPVSLTDGNTPIAIPDGEAFYYTDAISAHASRFVEEHHGDGPFFMYVAYTAPHWPLHALPEDIERYHGRYDGGWDALRIERFERMREMGLIDARWALAPRDRSVPEFENAGHLDWQRRAMEVYAAMIDRMDQGIGEIIAALEQTGKLDNTIVFFLADNGGCAEGGTAFDKEGRTSGLSCMFKMTRDGRPVHFGNYATHLPGPADTYQEYGKPWANASNTPFRLYKHWVHEGGIATPLIIHWPAGIDARGELRSEPGHVIDLLPTCVELAGGSYPEQHNGQTIQPVAGRSLAPAFRAEPIEREALFWEHEGNRAVRVDDWKLVARGRKGAWELYDMAADRTELHDLAADRPEVVERLSTMWQAWAERSQVLPWPK